MTVLSFTPSRIGIISVRLTQSYGSVGNSNLTGMSGELSGVCPVIDDIGTSLEDDEGVAVFDEADVSTGDAWAAQDCATTSKPRVDATKASITT